MEESLYLPVCEYVRKTQDKENYDITNIEIVCEKEDKVIVKFKLVHVNEPTSETVPYTMTTVNKSDLTNIAG